MTPMQPVYALVRRFCQSKQGVAAIEFALIVPVLAAILFGSLMLFLLHQESNRAEAATFTVADIVSRRSTVNKAFLDTNYAMFLKMLPARASDVTFRVSSLKMKAGKTEVAWSYPISPLGPLTDVNALSGRLPSIAEGDSLVIVETTTAYTPVVGFFGLTAGQFANVAANRPRFTAAIAYSN
ncbi:TadE/TadG family type IV pilus assembly protein [Antarcticirhabdus aurantiaca]|uniref:Pilus assembly protein n=1 Tax=Antarcticirhabdus aurantiaca TaxID=2606717 RepID=A0ACD4NQ18_9HYPH|nr:TadE/TadG family type IV pilus assembly protein [Antarcticirhabdus aurantiaca]WAJ28932.1 pilus assembly protein [Jeongeuplla avenae]